MMLKLLEADDPISDKEFEAFEKQIKLPLPREMKALYLHANGGRPALPYVHDQKHLFPVQAFYSLKELQDNLTWFDDESFPAGFKKGDLLPFAYFPGNGEYALSLRNHDFGRIYFYVLEEEASIYGEWPSFEEFLDGFVEDGGE